MIRKFKVYNKKYKEVQAFLQYDTETKKYTMQILEDYTGMHPDCMFMEMNKRGIVEVPDYLISNWVESRVIPPDRQCMSTILDDLGLKEYDQFTFLMLGHGESQMDFSCLIEITDENTKKR